MVLGRSRVKTQPAFPRALTAQPTEWRFAAGAPLYESMVDLTGAFPGYIERGARIEHARLAVYEHGLAVDEGRTDGFYLAFERIIATDEDELELDDEPVIRIRYREGADSRLFSIRPRAPRLMLRGGGGRRATRLHTVLLEQGVAGGPVDDIPGDAFLTHWGETDAFGHETMVWHGHASASLLLTGERMPCDVFITSKSIVWGRDARSPISRVPLHLIRDVTPGHGGTRGNHPAAFIGIGDGEHDRIEFSFIFDSYEGGDRNALERSAFIVHLRSRNVALNHPQAPDQPWMRAPMPDPIPTPIWPSGVTAVRGQQDLTRPILVHTGESERDIPTVPKFRDPVERLRPDRGVMTAHNWSTFGDSVSAWPEGILPMADSINGISPEETNTSDDRVLSEFSPPEVLIAPDAVSTPLPVPIDDPVRAYEADALSSLNDVFEVVRRRESGEKSANVHRRPPSGAALTAALESVVERVARNEITPGVASTRKIRLLALDDAARRLDVLLPLHVNGAISIRELRDRTDALCKELNGVLFAGSR